MTQIFAQPRDAAVLARSALQMGRLEEARRHFGQAVASNPRDAMLIVEAAVVEGQVGELKTAERLLERALKLDPRNADAWYNLGQVARERDQLDRAVRMFRKALELNPEYANAAFGLGEALYVQSKADEALSWLDRASRRQPNDPEILHVKALALDHLGHVQDAIGAYREVLRLKPDHVNARLNLAAVSARVTDPLEALEQIDRAESSTGIPPEGYTIAAQTLQLGGQNDRALAYVNRSLAAGVHVAEAMTIRANILIDSGDFDAAEAELHKVLSIKKDDPVAYHRLAVIKRLGPEAERALLKKAHNRTASAVARYSALFALYHLYDRAGDYERAFESLTEANTLKGRDDDYDVPGHEKKCARMAEVYAPEIIAEQRQHGFDKSGPVYIFGMPRSGTTLTEQILAAHPDVYPGGERHDVHRVITRTKVGPEPLLSLDAASLQEHGREIYDALFAAADGRRLATDKTPGHYLLVGAIACMLPRAKLVYVRRDPRDNALSLFEQSFTRGLGYSYDLAKIGAVYRQHELLMQHWIETCRLPIHTVDYDELVQDPEPHIRRLLDFVGLDFRPECLAPDRVERLVRTASAWQVRQPISAKSVGRWRRYETHLKPFVEALEGRS